VSSSAAGAATVKLSVPSDVELTAASSSSDVLLSWNPSATNGQFTAGTLQLGDATSIAFIKGGTFQTFQEATPISEGEAIYCAFASAGSVLLYLQEQ